MSTNRLRPQLDQENQHKVGPAKNELRVPLQRENSVGANMPSKRPLLAKGSGNEKRPRVPLGGKDQNKIIPGLQRLKLSLPLTFQTAPLRQPGPGHVTSGMPALARSNSSLGFFNRPTKAAQPQEIARPKTNPHKNNLLPPAEQQRSTELVPHFSSDTLTKPPARVLPAPETSLKDTFSASTAKLHASNVDTYDFFAKNVDPVKKGARDPELELLIDRLAEDESSIETRPERTEPELDDVPLGLSPLTELEAPFLFKDDPKPKLTDMFAPDTKFHFEEAEDDVCSETEAALNRAFHEELHTGDEPLGLSTADLETLLDF